MAASEDDRRASRPPLRLDRHRLGCRAGDTRRRPAQIEDDAPDPLLAALHRLGDDMLDEQIPERLLEVLQSGDDDLSTMRDLPAERARGDMAVAGGAEDRTMTSGPCIRLRPDTARRRRERVVMHAIFVTAIAKIAKERARAGFAILPKSWEALKRAIARTTA